MALAATLGSGALVGLIAAGRARVTGAGVLAGLTFVALGLPGSGPIPWTALYKEDTLALGLALSALAILQRYSHLRIGLVAAGAFAALAVLTKQTLGPMVLAPAVWFWLGCRDPRPALYFGLSCVVPLVVVSLALQADTGVYLQSILLPAGGPNSLDWLRQNVQLLALFQIGPLLAAAVYWWRGPRAEDDGLLLSACVGAALPMVALYKVGGGSNHAMLFAALVAVFAARAVWRPSRVGPAVFAAGVLVAFAVGGATWTRSLVDFRSNGALAEATIGLIARARTIDADVLSDPMDVAVLAGHEALFDPLSFGLNFASGRWSAEPVVREICEGRVELVVLHQPIDELDWPAPVVSALERTMRLEARVGDRLVYVPAGAASC